MDRTTRARTTDPETSRAAATRLTEDKLTAAQALVLRILRVYGDLPDVKLVEYLNDAERTLGYTKLMSPSGVRSRRSELSKPNMERLNEIATEIINGVNGDPLMMGPTIPNGFSELERDDQVKARARLRTEGFRSPLWDTGKRVEIGGSKMIVWGVAV